MKKPIYLSLLLSFFLVSFWANGQQVDLQGVSISPSTNTPIAINQIQTVQIVMVNNGPGAIPVSQATFTATVDAAHLKLDTPLAFVDASGKWAVTSQAGNTIQVANNGGPLPGDPSVGYIITFNVRGTAATGATPAPLNLTSSLSLTATVSDANGNNQSASGAITVTSAQPVSLVSFKATAQENRTVDVAWTTSFETSNKGFVVERSRDLTSFEKVGEISDVAASSNSLKTYHLTDQTPYSGTSYYRLTQIDLNGRTTTFPVASVILRDEAYGVFPNPVVRDQRFTLRLDEPETAVVKFLSADGRLLPLQTTGVQSGNLLLKTPSNLSAGVYIVTVEERGMTRQHRIIVE